MTHTGVFDPGSKFSRSLGYYEPVFHASIDAIAEPSGAQFKLYIENMSKKIVVR